MLHKNSAPGNIHTLVNWEVADATALAALVLDGSDLYKLAYQIDTGDFKFLIDEVVPTWLSVANAAAFQPLDTQLTDLSLLAYMGQAGQLVAVNATEDGFELISPVGGITDHTLLSNIGTRTHAQLESDIAAKQDLDAQLTSLAGLSYTGNTLKVVRVNAAETAFELATPSGGGGLTNITESLTTAAPNATVNTANLAVTGGTANTDLVLQPRGTGAFLLDIPDNLVAGGNKRGTYAVDLQIQRTVNSQVASGNNSIILAGNSNTAPNTNAVAAGTSCIASGINSIAVGSTCTASGSPSVAMGSNCTASGVGAVALGSGCSGTGISIGQSATGTTNAVAIGLNCNASNVRCVAIGDGNTAGGVGGHAFGRHSTNRNVDCSFAYGAEQFAAQGDRQTRRTLISRQTTNATPSVLSADKAALSATNQVGLPNNHAASVRGVMVARDTATNDTLVIEFKGAVKRAASAATFAIVGAFTQADIARDAGAATWTLAFSTDTTNGALVLTVTGEAAKTIRWNAEVTTVEIG